MKNQVMKHPCKNCPMKKDSLKGWLGEDRMRGILESDTFACHSTTGENSAKWKQCAGHMLLVERNLFIRMSQRFGVNLEISGKDLVFESIEECINHHKN